MKYSYAELPTDEQLISLDNIGPYLFGRLQKRGVTTGNDLLAFLEDFVAQIIDEDIPVSDAKEELTQWLSEVLQNARPLHCDSSNTRIRKSKQYSYHIRYANKNAFNEIVNFWRFHTKPKSVHRRIIPSLKTPRSNAFPTECRARR